MQNLFIKLRFCFFKCLFLFDIKVCFYIFFSRYVLKIFLVFFINFIKLFVNKITKIGNYFQVLKLGYTHFSQKFQHQVFERGPYRFRTQRRPQWQWFINKLSFNRKNVFDNNTETASLKKLTNRKKGLIAFLVFSHLWLKKEKNTFCRKYGLHS